ncbi:alpha/beta hydrolase [Clostridium botulinum]|uniref:Alpha/beta hydrolase n=1 Tax=Clostridium botulinum TaxID=1491 RepID=A0AAU8Z0K1_CLOBO|nr:alpha/beta hydrolase [Clostridium sporogenes]AVP65502.1 alpha/beta hydrolase [Clostridium botulinum]MCF4015661.1 alpha/beta hydrolase [Clostridium sporogenes]
MKVILLILLILLLVIVFVVSWRLTDVVIYPIVRKAEFTYQKEIEQGGFVEEEFNKLEKEEITIKSPFGYDLKGMYFPGKNPKETVIICHGIKCNLYNSVKYMKIFMEKGFNGVIYDHRNHGSSGGENTTFGYYEKQDLKVVADWVFERNGEDSIVGIHGESMGAGTILQNAAIDDRIAFYVADCPYSSMKGILQLRLKEDYKLPAFPFIPVASFISKLRVGVLFSQVSPIKDIEKVETPILFIHGIEDEYIPKEMSIDMYKNKRIGIKDIYLAPNADHAESYIKNKKEYKERIYKFLEEINL